MALVLNGSGTITGLNAGGLPDGSITSDDLASSVAMGKVLQVVNANKTDQWSTTSGTLTSITGLSVDITPASTSSKILVMTNLSICSTYYLWHAGLFANGTEVALADNDAGRPRGFLTATNDSPPQTSHGQVEKMGLSVVLSPSTTSTITYDIRASRRPDSSSTTTYVNRSVPHRNSGSTYDATNMSSIIAIEIGA